MARNNVYVLADGTISLSVTLADDVLPVLAQEDIVRDVRGGVIHNYPLVKIGTQYCMRSNLETSLYVNGDALPKLNQVTANIAGYLQSTTYIPTGIPLKPDKLVAGCTCSSVFRDNQVPDFNKEASPFK